MATRSASRSSIPASRRAAISLGGRADRFFDFTTDGEAGHPYDDYGHGTHVATLIAGKGKDSENDVERFNNGKWHRSKLALYRGVAPKARIISLKVLDRNGAGFTSSVLRALEFAIENKDKLKIDIINLSLGHPVYESPEHRPAGARCRGCSPCRNRCRDFGGELRTQSGDW